MRHLKFGKNYQAGLKRIPEGIVFDFNQSGGFLQIVIDRPLDSEIKEIKEGNIKLGLFEKEGIIFLFIKFGSLSWLDAPFYVGFSKPFELEELTDETMGYLIQVVLVDRITRMVKALKLIRLPNEMSLRFKELVEKQRETQKIDYNRTLSQIYSRATTMDFLNEADMYLFN